VLKYVGKRLLASLVTLFIILTTVFILMRQMPIEGYFDNFDKVDQRSSTPSCSSWACGTLCTSS